MIYIIKIMIIYNDYILYAKLNYNYNSIVNICLLLFRKIIKYKFH